MTVIHPQCGERNKSQQKLKGAHVTIGQSSALYCSLISSPAMKSEHRYTRVHHLVNRADFFPAGNSNCECVISSAFLFLKKCSHVSDTQYFPQRIETQNAIVIYQLDQ